MFLSKVGKKSLASAAVKNYLRTKTDLLFVGRLAKMFWLHHISFLHQTQQLIPNAGGHSSLQDDNPTPAFILLF